MSDIATASLVLSGFVVLVAVLLGWREWADRRDRSPDLSPEDARHFGHQDNRRTLGLVVLVALAVGLVVGSRIPHKFANQTNPPFLAIWFGVFLLIFLLLALAMIDWIALRIFARRHRNEILRERIEILKDEARRKKAIGPAGNGHHEGPPGEFFGEARPHWSYLRPDGTRRVRSVDRADRLGRFGSGLENTVRRADPTCAIRTPFLPQEILR